MFLGKALQIAKKYILAFTPLELPNLENWLGNFSTSFNKKNALSISNDDIGTAFADNTTGTVSILASEDVSVSFWTKYVLTQSGRAQVFFSGSDSGLSLEISQTSGSFKIRFRGSISGNLDYDAASVMSTNDTWYFITVSIQNNLPRLFINGTEQTLTENDLSFTGTYKDISSFYVNGALYCQSLMDNYALFKRALTLADHVYLYNSSNGIDYENIGNVTVPKYAAILNGDTSYLNSTSTDFDKSGTDNFSIGFWFKVEVGEELFVGQFASTTPATRSYSIQRSAANILVAQISDGTTLTDTPNYALSNTGWNFVTSTYDGSTLRLYLNGSLIESVSQTNGANGSNGGDFEIGRRNGSVYSTGMVQNVFFYSKELTLSEHQALYNNDNGLKYSDLTTAQKTNLVSWWSLNETSGTRNDSHSTNNLTENGTVGFDEGKVGTQEVAMTTNLTAWWGMNEISGTRFDLHSTNDLTENGTVSTSVGKVQGVPNNGDYVYSWVDESSNGNDLIQATGSNQPTYTNGYCRFVDGTDNLDATINALSGDFTIAFWFRADSSVSNMYALVIGTDDTTLNISFDFNDTQALKLLWNGSNAITSGTAGDYTDGTWRHFAAVRNGSTIELFVNNTSVGTSTTNTSFTSGVNLTLGSKIDNTTGILNGNMYQPIITGSAITEQQRKDLYNYNQPT